LLDNLIEGLYSAILLVLFYTRKVLSNTPVSRLSIVTVAYIFTSPILNNKSSIVLGGTIRSNEFLDYR